MKTLFVTATGQTEANYYLIWHLFKVNNTDLKRIVILSTDYTRKSNFVKHLINVLTLPEIGLQADIVVEELHLPDGVEEKNVPAIKQIIETWINVNKPQGIIFNVTGGTKLITIAQDQIARDNSNYQCVYQSRSNNQLVWYNEPQPSLYNISLPESMTARLKARGYEQIKNQPFLELPVAQWQYVAQMYKLMKIDLNKVQRVVSFLNYVVSQFDVKRVTYPYTVEIDSSSNYVDLAGWLKTLANLDTPFYRIESTDNKKVKVSFDTQEDAGFVSGLWFEVLVGFLLAGHYQSKETPVDIQLGLTFANNSDGNEIDVAYLLKGHFYWMECKTVNWSKKDAPTTQVNNNLHKLSSISQVAGLNSHKFFISLYDISKQSRKVAEDLGVIVIAGNDLFKFSQILKMVE